MNTTLRIALMIGAGASLWAAGCIPVAVGAGMGVAGYQYNQGELEYSIYANVDKSRRAAGDVIKHNQWDVKEQHSDYTSAFYRCITKDGTQVKVDISRRSPDFTRVAVRYGVFGDETESKRFIEQVKAQL